MEALHPDCYMMLQEDADYRIEICEWCHTKKTEYATGLCDYIQAECYSHSAQTGLMKIHTFMLKRILIYQE